MSKFVHQELLTSDPTAAKEFYARLFDWKFQEVPMPDGMYLMVSGPDGEGVGGVTTSTPGVDAGWVGYIAVASVDATTENVIANGGAVLLPKREVPGMGWFAWFADPQGVRFAVWEAVAPPPKAAKKKAVKKKAAKKKPAKKKPAKKKAAKKKSAKKKAAKKKPAKKKAAKKKPAKKKPAKKKPAKKKPAKKKPAKNRRR